MQGAGSQDIRPFVLTKKRMCDTMATKKGAGGEPQEYDTSTGQYGSGRTFRQNTPHHEISEALERGAEKEKVSGAISGALNPSSERAQEHAVKYYRALRKRKDDVAKVARSSGYSEDVIQAVKSYLFIDEHDLGGRIAPFYPDYDIAESWRRLSEGKPLSHDIVLIEHEIMEMSLIKDGFSQQEAHDRTNKKYNYREAVNQFNSEREKDGKSK